MEEAAGGANVNEGENSSDEPPTKLMKVNSAVKSHLRTTVGPGECKHEIVMKQMCASCGKDLLDKKTFTGLIEGTSAKVSMIHHVPELLVSKDLAQEIGALDQENVLKQRKLVLLVDLDQTLIHTSNRPPKPQEAASAIPIRLQNTHYFTKIRPIAREFLQRISALYEMHIVTFGQRLYAHRIAELLDPERKYFDYRLLSRDELASCMDKTLNLQALFPLGNQLIVMIDDRPDVWQYSDQLVLVKPYRYFDDIDDINNPQNLRAPNEDNNGSVAQTVNKKRAANAGDNTEENAEEKKAEKLSDPVPQIADNDNTLEYIEKVLRKIHAGFYEAYDKDKKIFEVQSVITPLRRKVLDGEYVVFSGIFPLGIDPSLHWLYKMTEKFGAVIKDQVDDRTTVVVAAIPGTEKVRQARKHGIPIVVQEWLKCCIYQWENVDKEPFSLYKDDQPSSSSNDTKLSSSHRAQALSSAHQNHASSSSVAGSSSSGGGSGIGDGGIGLAQIPTIARESLRRMSNEVDELLEDDDDDDENNDDDDGINDEYEDKDDSEDGEYDENKFVTDEDSRPTAGRTFDANNLEEDSNLVSTYGDDDGSSSEYDEMAADIENQLNSMDTETSGVASGSQQPQCEAEVKGSASPPPEDP